MIEHLNEYVIQQPQHKFVLLEKRHKTAEIFIDSIQETGWNNIVYFDESVLLIVNDGTKKIMLIAHTITEPLADGKKIFNCFSSMSTDNTVDDFYISIIFDVDLSEVAKNFKIKKFINYYLSILSQCLNVVNEVKELMVKYNSRDIKYSEIENTFIKIRMDLQAQKTKTLDSFYE